MTIDIATLYSRIRMAADLAMPTVCEADPTAPVFRDIFADPRDMARDAEIEKITRNTMEGIAPGLYAEAHEAYISKC